MGPDACFANPLALIQIKNPGFSKPPLKDDRQKH